MRAVTGGFSYSMERRTTLPRPSPGSPLWCWRNSVGTLEGEEGPLNRLIHTPALWFVCGPSLVVTQQKLLGGVAFPPMCDHKQPSMMPLFTCQLTLISCKDRPLWTGLINDAMSARMSSSKMHLLFFCTFSVSSLLLLFVSLGHCAHYLFNLFG